MTAIPLPPADPAYQLGLLALSGYGYVTARVIDSAIRTVEADDDAERLTGARYAGFVLTAAVGWPLLLVYAGIRWFVR